MEGLDLVRVWARSIEGLPADALSAQQRAWLTMTKPIGMVGDTALLAAPNEFAKDVIESRLLEVIIHALSREFGREITVAVTVKRDLVAAEEQPARPAPEVVPAAPPQEAASDETVFTDARYGADRRAQDQDGYSGPIHTQRDPFSRPSPAQGYAQADNRFRDEAGPYASADRSFGAGGDQYPPSSQFDRPSPRHAAPNHRGAPSHAAPPERHDPAPPSRRSENPHDPFIPTPAQPGHGGWQGQRHAEPDRPAAEPARLNPKYTFETFVTGSSNRFAQAASVAVAEAPAKTYNPLFIYGDSGLGKTHMLHAIGHYARSLFNGARVRYVSSEEFTNDFINAIRDGKADGFRRRYRDVDILLVDDIQFLENKEQTQEEFFHTFNTLHNANKQIVISSDRPPKQLVTLEDRLRNRFEWGLITDVQPPELETRIAILRKKAAQEGLAVPPEVLEYIASKISTNIRELEGALIRVSAFASLNRQSVDHQLAEIVLKDLIPDSAGPDITSALILAQTADYFGLDIDQICGTSRSRALVTARQIAMYLCRELTDLSLPKIGQQFGGRDHTTVLHADKKIRKLMAEKRSIYNQVTELTTRIKHQARNV